MTDSPQPDDRPRADDDSVAGHRRREPTVGEGGSLRLRLLLATFAGLAVALTLAGIGLSDLFRNHVMRQFEDTLTRQLDEVTAGLRVGEAGAPEVDGSRLPDPRWRRPYSGLYWQVDRMADDGDSRSGVLRSRSLWDAQITLEADPLDDGAVHVHETGGPRGAPLLAIERTVRLQETADTRWRLIVASEMVGVQSALDDFNGALAVSLGVLGLLMALAAFAQVHVGLRPLRGLRSALADVRSGQRERLTGRFPTEVRALVDDFNAVLERDARRVERARTEAGDLAHALKTPLAVLANAATKTLDGHPARSASPITAAVTPDGSPARPKASDDAAALARLVGEQVATVRRNVDWHLARARRAAGRESALRRTAVAPEIAALVRVMTHVHAARELTFETPAVGPDTAYAGDREDLHEMLGNLLDNACKWARTTVSIAAGIDADGWLEITVDDDGPGLSPGDRSAVLRRGVRRDESTPGSGLGLAIVDDLTLSAGGSLALEPSPQGGLRARLRLPAAS